MSFRIKDFIVPLTLAFSITLLFQYLFFQDNAGVKTDKAELESGRNRIAPRIQEVHRPLDLEVDFIDTKSTQDAKTVWVETDFAKLLFSTDGAAIEQAEFKHTVNGQHLLKTITASGKGDRCLLIAFNEKTPFYYELVKNEATDNATFLNYVADFDGGKITKKYTIYKHICKIDLEIIVEPIKTLPEPIRLRIMYPSPKMFDVNDIIQGIYNEANSIIKKPMNNLMQRYWEIPSLFGLEDNYFVNSMVKDANNFSQRGYFKPMSADLYMAILEGPAITEKSSWTLSFFFGPKKSSVINAVDPRLERSLDYGYLAPLSKPLLAILVFIYGFVHNYGVAIILLTLLIKLLLLPLSIKGEQSMKKRAEFQRKLQYIQQKYKGDKEGLALARAELIKKHGLGDMAGCLPLLLQVPIFIALNKVLSSSIELYGAPFLWIPNLSAKDPYYILPLLIALSMIIHSFFTAVDIRQRLSTFAIAILFSAFSAGLPAGLSLFIFMSAALSVLQSQLYSMVKKA